MFLPKKYINNKFETINAEKQELNCLNLRQSICLVMDVVTIFITKYLYKLLTPE